MIRFIMKIFKFGNDKPKILGRWGYHWESKLVYQKYYD
jgi:hypothetical protein